MQPQEEIRPLDNGLTLARKQVGNRVILTLGLKTSADCVLHWGLSRQPGAAWRRPPQECWPEGTTAVDGNAVRTPLQGNGEKKIALQLELPNRSRSLNFVLHFPKENRWLKCGGKDYAVELPRIPGGMPTPREALEKWLPGADVRRHDFTLDSGEQLAAGVEIAEDRIRIVLVCDAEMPLLLHWGLAARFHPEWQLPPTEFRPQGTVDFDHQAVHTPFAERDGLRCLTLEFRKLANTDLPRGIKFVLFQPESNAWLKSKGGDISLSLAGPLRDPRLTSPKLQELAEQIVGVEMGAPSWTLMHRYNLCHDLLESAQDDPDALALLFAWLRYSAIRQLDWQRHYNTKPRELSHAQDRLTARLASVWRKHEQARRWVRLMLTTLGRGGDGQRVRDEILQIMHRNNIKETAGHFIEEWHQKLHNNTTPDDVVICTAYLAFLRSNGKVQEFYRTLEAGGVTRERLKSFERPIRSDPDFLADRKDVLISEFENFLKILNSVHSGTDLDTAVGAARSRLPGSLQGKIDVVFRWRHEEAKVGDLAAAVAAAREELAGVMKNTGDDPGLRDLLFLDLALEEVLRRSIERQNLSKFDRDRLANLVQAVVRNLSVTDGSPELTLCARHWAALLGQPHDGKEWALHAKSVADRMGRWVQQHTDDVYRKLQPKAEFLGAAFEADDWVIPLFSEEVVRGGPAFALALLLRHLDPILRKAAGLGGWQVISPATVQGRVRVVESLRSVMEERYQEPTVLVTATVGGDEEVPEGAKAVLTSDTPDLVSHLAVRARNAHVLLATCYDPTVYKQLKDLVDKLVELRVSPAGDLAFAEIRALHAEAPSAKQESGGARRAKPKFSLEALTADKFTPEHVGGKSNNLNGLRGKLADWIKLPSSMALPFGACEQTLADPSNSERRTQYESLLQTVEKDVPGTLERLRRLVLELAPPEALRRSLESVWQSSGLPALGWDQVWTGVRRVWASKWNERAYLSRRARHVPHDDLLMAVLMQQVVPADYAFVLHTVNPITGNTGELFGEVVLGLGETLVGNYPGRALGFVCRKSDLAVDLISYPSKSEGLYGRGVIFRSDSNGEDLEGFAGAGLYDSFLAEEPEHRALDYSREKLLWDGGFRDELLRTIAKIGIEVERSLGSAQDIEGAVTGNQFFVVQTRPQVGLAERE